jgi:hypothetical protein
MSDNVIIQPVVTNLTVTSPGPQGPTGAQGLVPIFSRQNAISPVVGNTRFYFDSTRVISQVRASLGTAPTGSGATFDTLINGVSIGTVTIAAGQNTATLALNRTVNANDYATVSILSVGSTVAGADLTLVITVN